MHGFATLQQMVNQACHQAEGSEAFSPAALHAVHKLNRWDVTTSRTCTRLCLCSILDYIQALKLDLGGCPPSLEAFAGSCIRGLS